FQTSFTQSFSHEFGKCSAEEINMTKYAKDPTAEAVVIYDIGKSYFEITSTGYELIFERTTKIKVLSKAGLKYAEIEIPYYVDNNNSFEIVGKVTGNTYNLENGLVKATPLNPKIAFDEKINDKWHQKKLAMPDVKEGSVFEVNYKVVSPFFFNLRSWDFQSTIPVIFSEYTTKMVPFYEYCYIFQGATKFDEFQSYEEKGLPKIFNSIEYNDMVYHFVMKDVPAFRDEDFITSENDYLLKLDFQLAAIHRSDGANIDIITTWPKLSKELLINDNFGKYQNAAEKKSDDLAMTLDLGTKTDLERVKTIDRFVKSNFNWNGRYTKYTSKSVKEFLNSKTGNSAEINLFLAGMLAASGIEAYPVIISTREHGRLKLDYPFDHFFNYVIVLARIDSLNYLLDATEPMCDFGQIPTRCINDKGLVIQKQKEEWVSLKSNLISDKIFHLNLRFNVTTDSLLQNCLLSSNGYDAIDYRKKYISAYKELKTDLLGDNSSPTDSLLARNLKEIEKPFEIRFSKKSPSEWVEDKLLIAPFGDFVISENPFKQAARKVPVDMTYKKERGFISSISIPENYSLLSVPENLKIENELIKIVYVVETDPANHLIKVTGQYEIKSDVYPASDYNKIKDYYSRIVSKFNEKIVLVKTP
ncbi:MAG: transglutaminase domain-containing protein, partial [Bacteroidales bacterium]